MLDLTNLYCLRRYYEKESFTNSGTVRNAYCVLAIAISAEGRIYSSMSFSSSASAALTTLPSSACFLPWFFYW